MMRRLRRFAIALLGLLVFQASAVEASVACLMPAAADGATSSAGTAAVSTNDGRADDAHEAMGHGRHAGDRSHQDGGVAPDGARPPQPHHGPQQHCPASMTCASVAAAGVSTTVSERAVRASARVIAPRTNVPSSVVRGPEPPPPRA